MGIKSVIVLNGPSSSGKTAISKALQRQLDDIYLHFEMDVFWYMVPSDIEAHYQNFPKLKEGIVESALALLKKDHKLIVDIVLMPRQTDYLKERLDSFNPFIVGVTADLEVLNKRELQRGNRKIGLSASQYDQIHKNIDYDIMVDTTSSEAEEIARKIIEAM
jgi:chloramphenicol 3-O phosphotransferase